MSLDKAVYYKKEYRKKYRGSEVFDVTCRNHGKCSYCRNNRTYSSKRRSFCFNIKEQICDIIQDSNESAKSQNL